MRKTTKAMSLFIVIVVYLAAFMAGLIVFRLLASNPLLAFFIADVAATVIVWLMGLIFHNASMYDPYWSVAPIVLFICFLHTSSASDTVALLYLTVIIFWGVRLTLNWITDWPGLHHQDWRYTMLREQHSKLWPLTNFFGINMMPTLIVFVCMLPAYFSTLGTHHANILTFLGAVVCILSSVLQYVSDSQMRRFRKNTNGGNMQSGLWKYSRHPNYFGEVSFWWGVWIMQLSVLPRMWWTVFAPAAMSGLFIFISIPMMEKRLLSTKNVVVAAEKVIIMLLFYHGALFSLQIYMRRLSARYTAR